MRLPIPSDAIISKTKLVEYLLNPSHPENGGKAAFFFSLGFTREKAKTLAEAFREVAEHGTVARRLESPYGAKYIVDGELTSPEGRKATVRTVWIVETGQAGPRLVTAYPAKGQREDDA